MSNPDTRKTGDRPAPPPRPPALSRRSDPTRQSSGIPAILRIIIVVLTVIGILFALRAIYSRVTEKSPDTTAASSTDNTTGSSDNERSETKGKQDKESDSESVSETASTSSGKDPQSQAGQNTGTEDKPDGSSSSSSSNTKGEQGQGSQVTGSGPKTTGSGSTTTPGVQGTQGQEAKSVGLKSTGAASAKVPDHTNAFGQGEQGTGLGSTSSDITSVSFNIGELDRDLTLIQREHNDFYTTNVYQRIANNMRQSIQIQLAILKNNVGTGGASATHKKFEQRVESLRLLEEKDAPYYRNIIVSYSKLLAATSMEISALLMRQPDKNDQSSLDKQFAAIREPAREAACDAAFVTTVTFLAIGKEKARQSGDITIWSDLQCRIQAEQDSEEHIINKTNRAHRSLCDVLTLCVKAWDRKAKHTVALIQIEKERNQNIAVAQDYFFSLAVYTESEVRLLSLFAQVIQQ